MYSVMMTISKWIAPSLKRYQFIHFLSTAWLVCCFTTLSSMATSMLLGPLISMVNRQVSNYLLQQYQEMDGMEDQLAILERKLPAILDVIIDAEEQGTHRPGVSAWLKALKAVAYQANDIFDEFKYEALRREAKRRGHYRNLSTNGMLLARHPILFRYRMGKKLHKIVQSIEVLVAEMNAFGFKYRPQMPTSKQWRQTDSIIIDSENIISREEEKQHIINLLLARATNKDLMVLPIVGMGGLGKTTFAQIIYNNAEIKRHFQLHRWVCVLDDFDVTDISNKISMSSEKECESALEKLQQEICGKRYLLVLDDVWNRDADKWAKLKYCLQQCGGAGSAILMTTRDEGVAQIMGTTKAHQLVRMHEDDLLAIFEKRAFGFEERKPDELVQIGKKIMARCHGSPLAAKALGSVLSNQKGVEEWRAVLTKSSICDQESGILPILKLSYDDLPPHMKQCFAFCAVFPKNYEIDVEKLILLWMANDFIPSEEAICPETKGKHIFNELASRSFFQDVKQVSYHKDGSGYSYRTICSIHDLMHDVAVSVIGKECMNIVEGHNYIEFLPNTVRHLFLSSYGPETLSDVSLKKRCHGIQTLLFSVNTSTCLHHLSKCSSLRALHLCYHRLNGLPVRPKHLKHLRYLDLSGNCHIKALPEEICILYSLQTLNLSGCESLGQLPDDIKYITGLRHLYTDGCMSLKCMPPNLGQLTSLQTLTYFVVGCISGCGSIGELRRLNLRGKLQLCHLENVTEEDVSMINHGDRKDLTQLSFVWKDDCNEVIDFHEKVLDAFTPNNRLQILSVDSYRSSRFPIWMTNLTMMQDLIRLQLVSCTMCVSLPQLWKLPALQVLHLERLDRLQCLCTGGRDNLTYSTFPKLRELMLLDLNSMNRWWEVKGRHGEKLLFPVLEELTIDSCAKLETFPEPPMIGESSCCLDNKGYSSFPALKKLILHNLKSLNTWGTQEERYEKQIFPVLQNTNIMDCPELATLPEAPKLRVLVFPENRPLMWLSIGRYMATLSDVRLRITPSSSTQVQCSIQQVDCKEKLSHKAFHATMELRGCYFFYTVWECFVNLGDLEIIGCDEVIHWPVKQLKCLVSLKRLTIDCCNNLTGSAEVLEEVALSRNQLLPCLEYLKIKDCPNFVEVFILPPSLREMYIERCRKLEFIWGKQGSESESFYVEHQNNLNTSGSCYHLTASLSTRELLSLAINHVLPCMESLTVISCQSLVELLSFPLYLKEVHIWSCPKLGSIRGAQYTESCSSDHIASVVAEDPLTATRNHILPCLEYLRIAYCETLVEVLDLPSTMRKIIISECPKLEVLSGKFDKLGHLDIRFCDKLRLVESCQGVFLSLGTFSIVGCENMTSIFHTE